MSQQTKTRQGGCLCGNVRYTIHGETKDPTACHCSQCARTSGNYAAMAACHKDDLAIQTSATLAWYRSSPNVERGFCARCGGNLFWRDTTASEIYVTAGSLDRPTGLTLSEHIFTGSMSDFYKIADDLPQKEAW